MDKIRRLFRRKGRQSTASVIAPSNGKRGRLSDEHVDEVDPETPRKRTRRASPDFRLPEFPFNGQKTSIDNLSTSQSSHFRSSIASTDAPTLDWAPKSTDFSEMLSFDSWGSQPSTRPSRKPVGALDAATQAKRQSLPPAAVFARGVKRFSEFEPSQQNESPPRDSTRLMQTAGTMSLDDLLNKPMFEDRNSNVGHATEDYKAKH